MNLYEEYLNSLPNNIIEEILEEQQKQGNPKNLEIFIRKLGTSKPFGGFDWCESKKGTKYWNKILVTDYYTWLENYKNLINVNLILI